MPSIRLRPVRSDDAPRMRAFIRRVSPETRYKRFHTHLSDLTPAMVRHLVEVDGENHVALVATDIADEIVADARFIRVVDDEGAAEIAITVDDAYQNLGLGSVMLDRLTAIASATGIREMVAYTLPNNTPLERLFGHIGPVTRRAWKSSYGIELRARMQ